MGSGSHRLLEASDALKGVARRVASGEATRDELDFVIAEIVGAQLALFGPRPRAPRGSGARQQILTYLKARVGQNVTGAELAAVSGIAEWARRLRELRVEHGYEITEVGDSVYRLESIDPDIERARRWSTANAIRRQPGSALDRIKRFLQEHEGDIVDRSQIDYVARIREGSRRIRELRDEQGWPINSHIDEAELRPGEYRLISADPESRRDRRQRLYPEDLRERIFARDAYTCQVCGRDRQRAVAAGDTRFYLEVHHRTAVAEELDGLSQEALNDPTNLVTLCHADHIRETEIFQTVRRTRRQTR